MILPVVGFTATGVGAGSLAAGTQSVVYGGLTTGKGFALSFRFRTLKIKQDLLEPLIRHVFTLPISWCCGSTSDDEDWSCHWRGLLGHKLQHGQIKTI